MRAILFIEIILLHVFVRLQAQPGEIVGRIVDDKGEGMPFITVTAEQDGKLVRGVQADFDGYYSLRLDTGTYDIKVTSESAATKIIRGVTACSNKVIGLDITTSEKIAGPDRVEVRYNKPMVVKEEMDNVFETMSDEEISAFKQQGVPQVIELSNFNRLRRGKAGEDMTKTKKFAWDEITCRYEGLYYSRKLSEERLRNTWSLINTLSPYSLRIPYVENPEDIDKLNLGSLDNEYTDRLKKLRKVKVVRARFWREEKNLRITQLKEEHEWITARIKGYKDPAFLKSYKYADVCIEYIDALQQGGEKLLSSWQQMEDSICSHQTDQAGCYKRGYQEKANTPERYEYARINVMDYGWWNCIARARAADYLNQANQRTNPLEEFKKFFITVTRGCQI